MTERYIPESAVRKAIRHAMDGEWSENDATARIMALATATPQDTLSPADLLFGFGAWLTGMDSSYTVGAAHDASPMANLIASFLVSQELPPGTSNGFPDNLQTYPPTPPELLAPSTAAPQDEAPELEGLREAYLDGYEDGEYGPKEPRHD